MNVLELLKEFATKSGIKDNQEFDLALAGSASETLKTLELPDSVVTIMRTNLMDTAQAKANMDIKNHFIGAFASGLEKDYFDGLKASGFDEESIAEIKAASTSTGQRVLKGMEKFQAKITEAQKASGKGNSEEYVKKIAEAQKALDDFKVSSEAEKVTLKNGFTSKLQDLWEKANLSGVSWNDALSEIARIPSYMAGRSAELKSLGGTLIFDTENQTAKIVNANDPTLPLMVDGKEFGYSDLHSVVLQKHKLLKESGGGPPNPPVPPFSQPPPGGKAAPTMSKSMTSAMTELRQTMEEMSKNQ